MLLKAALEIMMYIDKTFLKALKLNSNEKAREMIYPNLKMRSCYLSQKYAAEFNTNFLNV